MKKYRVVHYKLNTLNLLLIPLGCIVPNLKIRLSVEGLCIIVVLSPIHLALYLFTVVFLLFHFWLTPEEEPSSKRCVFLYISPCTVYEPTTCHSYDLYLNSATQLHDLNFIYIYIHDCYVSFINIKLPWDQTC